LTAINPERQSQQFSYDLLDRVTHIRKSDGNKVELRYNAYEEVVYVQDAHHKVSFEYSPLGSLKAREENGTRLEFHRDTEDRLVFLLNEHREAYRFRYDKRGMVIEEKGFDGIKRQFVRDAAGKIIRVNRLGGRFADYEYDLAGRLTRVEYSDGSWQVYSYDKNGNLVEAQNENSQVFIERDAAGRVIKEIQDGHVVESRYDKLGRRMEVKTSLGASIKMERDKAGFVSRMSADRQGENWEAQFTYNALGQETGRVLPGGIASSFSYDRGGRPESHTVTNGSRILRNRIYSWNVNDRLQSMMNGLSRGIVHYGHDDFGNLAWARYEDKQYDYRLPDKVGNLYRTPERSDRKYGAGGRLLQSRGVKYEYDEEGQLVSKSSSGGQWLYRWSGNGMLKSVMRPDGREVSFEYDGLGRRTAKIFNNRITRWVWDGNRPLHEWNYALEARPKTIVDEFGDVTQDNPEPLDGMISWLFDEGTFRPAAKLQEGVVQSIITDYLGTPVEMYDAEGRQTWSVEYDIYGKIRKQILGKFAECPFRYQGQYEDEETGLYYNRFRYYDSSSGTYLSQDPIGLSGGMAFYGYVRDPNAWVDILGLNCSAAQRKANKSSGKKAEDLVHNKLQNNPDVEVLGRQVTVHTSEGVRYVDVLIRNKKTGKVIAVEVKGGRAKRNSNQISKDKIINNGGGTFGSSGFSNPDNPLIGTSTTNTTTSVTQVPSWKL
jgi:RHS repeat-associated protein